MGEMQPQQADWGCPLGHRDAASMLRVAVLHVCAHAPCRELHGNPATCCSLPCELTDLPHKQIVAGPLVQRH